MGTMGYYVMGRRADGSTVYYTGRAGQAFVAEGIGAAFLYDTLIGAQRRAANLNRMTDVHGIRFFAPQGEYADQTVRAR